MVPLNKFSVLADLIRLQLLERAQSAMTFTCEQRSCRASGAYHARLIIRVSYSRVAALDFLELLRGGVSRWAALWHVTEHMTFSESRLCRGLRWKGNKRVCDTKVKRSMRFIIDRVSIILDCGWLPLRGIKGIMRVRSRGGQRDLAFGSSMGFSFPDNESNCIPKKPHVKSMFIVI